MPVVKPVPRVRRAMYGVYQTIAERNPVALFLSASEAMRWSRAHGGGHTVRVDVIVSPLVSPNGSPGLEDGKVT